MKAGILTFHNAHNYGAALQVLATQTWMTRKGYDCEVINYRIAKIDRTYAATSSKRKKRFEAFMQKNLKLSPLYTTLDGLQAADLPYDVIIAGSDQIWNSVILRGLNAAFFCDLGRPDARRIVYAASLGSDALSPANRFLLPQYLRYPDFISVREKSMLKLIQPLTEKPVCTVLDPTFLLDLSDYQKLVIPQNISTPYIYLHYVHHTGENPKLDLAAKRLSEATGLPILKNRPDQRFANELPSCQDNGPGEFLGTLSEAAYVVTDSFHATVFSILFSKHFLTVAPVKRPERLIELLSLLNLDAHLYSDSFHPEAFTALPSYKDELPPLLEQLRADSVAFLEHALTAEIERKPFSYPSTKNPYFCYGCGACTRTNPDCAGTMVTDRDGFHYPSGTVEPISEDNSPCIFSATGSSCASLKNPSVHTEADNASRAVYLAYHKDLYSRMISFEGGVLTEFFRQIHRQNGVVIGKAYDTKSGSCRYILSDNEADSQQLLAVCPQEADITTLFELVPQIPTDRPVLLCATPCHIEGFRHAVPQLANHIITVEFSCGGVTSDITTQAYFNLLQQNHENGSGIVNYNLQAKHYGQYGIRAEFTHEDGSSTPKYISLCPLAQAYRSAAIQRPSCYTCTFRDTFPRLADITLTSVNSGQAPEFVPEDKFVSAVAINSVVGKRFYDSCRDAFTDQQITNEKAVLQLFPLPKFKLTAARPLFYQDLHAGEASSAFDRFKATKKKN